MAQSVAPVAAISSPPPVSRSPVEVNEPLAAKPSTYPEQAAIEPKQVAADEDTPKIAEASDDLDWSHLAYRLELEKLATQVAINTVVLTWTDNRLQLAYLPELEVMIKPDTEQQIRQALQSALGVELALEFVAQPELGAETPYQARLRAEAEARQQAIAAIRQDPTVQQLNTLFGAELMENTVKKINQ